MAETGIILYSNGLLISSELLGRMFDHIDRCLPEEACGVLGGTENRVEEVVPVTNQLHSPTRFRMAPEEQLRAFKKLEDQGQEMLAFFHSHPAGPSVPSETDLVEFLYPGVLSVICSPAQNGWQARAFQLDDRVVVEVTMVVVS
jgi:proteasome lid subunit RPN8/RPN11